MIDFRFNLIVGAVLRLLVAGTIRRSSGSRGQRTDMTLGIPTSILAVIGDNLVNQGTLETSDKSKGLDAFQ